MGQWAAHSSWFLQGAQTLSQGGPPPQYHDLRPWYWTIHFLCILWLHVSLPIWQTRVVKQQYYKFCDLCAVNSITYELGTQTLGWTPQGACSVRRPGPRTVLYTKPLTSLKLLCKDFLPPHSLFSGISSKTFNCCTKNMTVLSAKTELWVQGGHYFRDCTDFKSICSMVFWFFFCLFVLLFLWFPGRELNPGHGVESAEA